MREKGSDILRRMDLEEYREVLIEAPPHGSKEFIDYIRKNNYVVDECESWILIENCKYNSKEGGYYTAFLKSSVRNQEMKVNMVLPREWSALWRLYQRHCDGWEIKIKRKRHQSIKRFHVHFIE